MFAHFTAPENLPFAVALGLFFLIGILQTVSLLTGISLFGWIDDLLPDFDFDADADFDVGGDFDVDVDAEAGPDTVAEASLVAQIFAWMNFGKVPFIISFLAFLFLFACIGYNAQLALFESGLGMLPAIIIAPIAFLVTLFPLKWANGILGRVVPKDETNAVSSHTFIGRVAAITIGEATHERTAEAKLRGPLGRTHYVMVKADREGDHFPQGEHVLLVGEEEGHFTVIAVTNENLDTEDEHAPHT